MGKKISLGCVELFQHDVWASDAVQPYCAMSDGLLAKHNLAPISRVAVACVVSWALDSPAC